MAFTCSHSIIQMQFLFFLIFIALTCADQYLFPEANISTTAVSSGSVRVEGSLSDVCMNLKVAGTWVYHLGSQNVYERWEKSNLSSSTSTLNFTLLFNHSVSGYQVSADESLISFMSSSFVNLTYIYSQSWQYTVFLNKSLARAAFVSQTFVEFPFIYEFYPSNSSISQPTFTKKNFNSLTVVKNASTSKIYDYMTVSPSSNYTAIWSQHTDCLFYSLTSLTSLGQYTPNNTPNTTTTSHIHFSADQSLVVIETDNFNPVVILSLLNFTVLHQISINDTIYEAIFLNSSNTFLVVFCQHATVYFNLQTSQEYSIPNLPTTVFALLENHLYTCAQNVIQKTYIQITINTTAPTSINNATSNTNSTASNTTTNSSNSQNSTSPSISPADSNNNPANSDNSSANNNSKAQNNTSDHIQSQFYYVLNLDAGSTQSKVLTNINSSLQKTTLIAYNLANLAASTPIAFYFLTFLNFISTSSLYVLLNYRLPQHIYTYFSMLYNQLNQSILDILGIKIEIPQWTDEMVDRQRPLYMKVTSDIVSQNYANFLLFPLNLALVFALNMILTLFIKDQNIVKQYLLSKDKKMMIYGQIFGLMQPLILPWSFILLKGGIRNTLTKLNQAAYSLFFFITALIPFFYYQELIVSRKKEGQDLLRTQKQENQRHQIQLAETLQLKSQRFIKPEKQVSNNLKDLLGDQFLSEWFLCQTNFIFPLLVLLQNPVIFLVVIMCHNVLGLWIASRTQIKRANNILLSLYPIIFHICFGVFYWSGSVKVIALAEIICLTSFLIGLVHNMITILFEFIVFLRKVVTSLCSNNKISPKKSQSEQVQQSQHEAQETKRTRFKFNIILQIQQKQYGLSQFKSTHTHRSKHTDRVKRKQAIGQAKRSKLKQVRKIRTEIPAPTHQPQHISPIRMKKIKQVRPKNVFFVEKDHSPSKTIQKKHFID